jgi:hypothetical protein
MPITIPEINVWDVTSQNIGLTWSMSNRSDTQYYNLYGCATYNGVYALVQSNIPNVADPRTPGSVYVNVVRSAAGIATDQPYYFKITAVDFSGSESAVAASNFVSVDPHDVYRAREQDDRNPVYKSLTLAVPTGMTNMFVDVKRILGREADYIKITTDQNISVKFNSSTNDAVPVDSTSPFIILQWTLVVTSIYVTNSSGSTANITILVTGN